MSGYISLKRLPFEILTEEEKEEGWVIDSDGNKSLWFTIPWGYHFGLTKKHVERFLEERRENRKKGIPCL